MKGLVKKKRKIPRAAVEPLLNACEMYSKMQGRAATEFFEEFLGLMDRYSDYFFSEPWPRKYDYKEATTFTDGDLDFLFECYVEEFDDRLTTVCLRKNISLEGFGGYFEMLWTHNAFHKQFVRPLFEPVLELFDGLTEETDARKVLDKMLEEHDNLWLIHDSLIDLLENSYPKKPVLKLIGEIFFLLHEDKKYPNCWHHRCDWYCKQKESPKSN